MKKFINIELKDIYIPESYLSETDLLSTQLRLEAGLAPCLTIPSVYKDGEKYVAITEKSALYSLSVLKNAWNKQECILVDKAYAAVAENEKTLSPSDIMKDIQEASDLWDTMPIDHKQHTTEMLYSMFAKRSGRFDKEYRRERFRPRVEYVNAITKMHMSNSTIVKYLKDNHLANISANIADRDEYYTKFEDVRSEVEQYKDQLWGRIVFCNCDDPAASNFTKYFLRNFRALGISRLISTGYPVSGGSKGRLPSGDACCLDITEDSLPNGAVDVEKLPLAILHGDAKYSGGDFRSKESVAILRMNPLVITNPPFSKAKAYISLLTTYHVDFLILADKNSVTLKEVFPYIQAGLFRTGTRRWNGGIWFETGHENDADKIVDGISLKNTSAIWLTNLEQHECNKPRRLTAVYKGNEELYSKYDEFDAINIDETEMIPYDYPGLMGCPITVLDNLCHEQFEIVWIDSPNVGMWSSQGPKLNGKTLFRRVIIRNKRPGFNDWDHWDNAV